jgi:phosphoserine phosphatase
MISNYARQVNELPDSDLFKIVDTLRDFKIRHQGPYYAAFDADGTLWDYDIAEIFLQFEIDHKLLAFQSDPRKTYWDYKAHDPRRAYWFLAALHQGVPLATVREWAKAAIKENPPPVFRTAEKLLNELRALDYEIFVVSASTLWIVEQGAALLGFSPEQCFGVSTAVDEAGLVTDQWVEPITWREGKMQAILQATGGAAPFFACGNTIGDTELLKTSRGLSLAVRTSTSDFHPELISSENLLQEEARKNNWLTHAYRLC